MKYRLGLDLGTNSIGWSIYSLDDENSPIKLEDLGVRIFSDGRNPKSKEPLAVERRTARGQRRIIRRRKQRRKATFKLLQNQRLSPTERAYFLDSALGLPLAKGDFWVSSEFGKRKNPFSLRKTE